MKGKLNFPVGNEYHGTNFENSAEMIKFSDTTLANALDNLSAGKISHADSVTYSEVAEKDSAGNVLSDTYLTLANAQMTGTPTAPTNSDTSCVATTSFVQEKIREICGDVESGMTLARLIESINKNPNFAADVASALNGKQNYSSRLDDLKNFSAGKVPYFDGNNFVGATVTEIGRKILAASDIESVRWLIQAQPEFAWDETEKIHWVKSGSPTITTANAKFNKALQVNSANKLYSQENITFGGNPFTIDIWCRGLQGIDYGDIFSGGDFGLRISSGQFQPYYGSYSQLLTCATGAMLHIELAYNPSALKIFVNGTHLHGVVINWTISRTARRITLGGAICSISSFRILDGICLHTGNFAVPTAPYELTDETVTLLNF